MKTSPNIDTKLINELTSHGKKLQYDRFNSTKEVVKEIRKDKETHIKSLTSQGFIIKAIWEISLKSMRTIWPTIQARLPKNIFNFTVRYLNNTLPTGSNMTLWGLSDSPNCSNCGQIESLKHVVAGCKTYTDEQRFNYGHDSVL